jgi:hypothetical protein
MVSTWPECIVCWLNHLHQRHKQKSLPGTLDVPRRLFAYAGGRTTHSSGLKKAKQESPLGKKFQGGLYGEIQLTS